MERVIFQNSRNLNLIGNLYTSPSKSIIVFSHGFTSDKTASGKYTKLAIILNELGYNVLTFDYSGCGESDDDTITLDKEVDDLNSAIKYVKSLGYENVSVCGSSLGGLVALKCTCSNLVTMVLWAPVTDKIKYTWDKRYSSEQLEELKEKGYITMIKEKRVRKIFMIDKQMLKDREQVNQKKVCNNVKVPVLIIHGTDDLNVPPNDSVSAMKHLPEGSKLEFIEGANHKFENHVDILIDLSKSWFSRHMKL